MKLAIAMAASGVATEAQRLVFNTVSRKLIEENDAEAIMLGGDRSCVGLQSTRHSVPALDSAAIHVDAIVRLVIS